MGLKLIAPRESAIVIQSKGKEGGISLKDGEDRKFEQIGKRVGSQILNLKRL